MVSSYTRHLWQQKCRERRRERERWRTEGKNGVYLNAWRQRRKVNERNEKKNCRRNGKQEWSEKKFSEFGLNCWVRTRSCHTIAAVSLKMKNEDPKYATHATTTSASAFMNIFLLANCAQLLCALARVRLQSYNMHFILYAFAWHFYAPSQYWCASSLHCPCIELLDIQHSHHILRTTKEKRRSSYSHITYTCTTTICAHWPAFIHGNCPRIHNNVIFVRS